MNNIILSSKPIEISDHKTYKEAIFLISVLDEWDENNRLIPKEVGEKYHSTIIGFPIVAKLIKDIDGNPVDFRGHEMKILVNEDGTKNYIFDTVAIGSVLESWVESREVAGYTGEKDCIMIKAKLWSERYPEYFTVLDKLWAENNVKSSWELTVEKSEKTIRGKIIKAFSFLGNCLLGSSIAGAVNGAGVYEYAESDMNDESNSEFVLASALSKDCEGFSDNNTEVKEENMAKTQENAESEVIEATKEVEEKATEKVEETPATEVSENENSEGKDNETAGDETTETSALTVYDLRKKINECCRKVYRWFWVSYMFPTENYVLGKTDEDGENELDYVKFTYSVSDDGTVTVGEPEKITLSVSVSQINATIAEKDDAIVKANQEIQTLKAENEELVSYKKRCQKADEEKEKAAIAQKQDDLRRYALNSKQITSEELETDEFKTIISELDEAKMKSIIADRVVASISKSKESKIETSEVEVSESPRANLSDNDDVLDYRAAINSFLGK